jgi:hypothetical protein
MYLEKAMDSGTITNQKDWYVTTTQEIKPKHNMEFLKSTKDLYLNGLAFIATVIMGTPLLLVGAFIFGVLIKGIVKVFMYAYS